MKYFIKSDIVLTECEIQYLNRGEVKTLPYNSIVWIYIRKKTREGGYRQISLLDVTLATGGDLVITDFANNTFVFWGACMRRPAGSIFSDILECYNACFAGYDRESEALWHENFKEMVRVCRMMQEAYGIDEPAAAQKKRTN